MVVLSGATRRVVIPFILAAGLAGTAGPSAMGATPQCRAHNVTQDTHGRSLIRMVERAVDGDELRVRGTCMGTMIVDADISITGVGAAPTLTGRDSVRVIEVRAGSTVLLRDLRIVEGWTAHKGAGIVTRGRSSTTLRGVTVARNRAMRAGGGIYNSGKLLIERSVLRANHTGENGGAIYNNRRIAVAHTLIEENSTAKIEPDGDTGGAGGIYNRHVMTVEDSVIRRNRAGLGGGIITSGEEAILTRVTVARNVADGPQGVWADGGGIVAFDGLAISQSAIRGNRAGKNGGGLAVWSGASGPVEVSGSVVSRNRAGTRGGGVWTASGLTLTDTTITANAADDRGGGIARRRFANGPVVLVGTSSVKGNSPDDCVGTAAC